MTKRAQTPISAWLPAAIAAPTPVRALVHSSTLVTAGIVLLIKFYFLLNYFLFQKFLIFIGLATIFSAGLSALIEIDFKKLVALSTLRQIGILVFILGLGTKWLALFHLVSHAFFKSCLFLVVGGGLHFIFTKQD
jgi:NADH-ubiquinone oxidoreductase chain 5